MYVCVCKGVTDKQIRQEVECGARSFDDIQDRLQVAMCCGQCRDYAMEVMNHAELTKLAIAV